MPEPTPILLKPDRRDELTLFLNRAFARPDDYPRFYPEDYAPPGKRTTDQYAILESGRIVAAAGVYPITWRIGQSTLRIACVGNVSVDPERRGHGLMQRLMQFVLEQIRREEYPLAVLGGQRQRYQYFGWERAGSWVKYTLNRSNLKHAPCFADLPPLTVEPLGDDPATTAALARLHAAQPVRCDRPPLHLDKWLRRWEAHPFIARAADGSVSGYAVVRGKPGGIIELVYDRPETALGIIRALVEREEAGTLACQVEPMNLPLQRLLGEFAEQMQVTEAGNWQVLDWPVVVGTLLQARHALTPLLPGSVTVHLPGRQTLRLFVEGNRAGCEIIPLRSDWVVEPMDLMRLLFGPLPPHQVLPLPPQAALLSAWCPLPLSIPMQDRF